MKYRVLYTDVIDREVIFEGPPGLDVETWFDAMEADEHAQVKRHDVTDRQVHSINDKQL